MRPALRHGRRATFVGFAIPNSANLRGLMISRQQRLCESACNDGTSSQRVMVMRSYLGLPRSGTQPVRGQLTTHERALVGLCRTAAFPVELSSFRLTHIYLRGYMSINSQSVIDQKCPTPTMCSSERSLIPLGGLSSNDCVAKESRPLVP